MKTINNIDHANIADYLIKIVQRKSISSGHQYIIDYDELEEIFGIITSNDLDSIYDQLMEREEVCDVIMDEESFDVNLYTDFAPNYEEDEDDEWY